MTKQPYGSPRAWLCAEGVHAEGSRTLVAHSAVFEDGSYRKLVEDASREGLKHFIVGFSTSGEGAIPHLSYSYTRQQWEQIEKEYPGKTLAELLLQPSVTATFQPEAWQNDYAIPVDGKTTFNALPNLLELSYVEVCEMFQAGTDFDCLANGLPECESHGGPFEVHLGVAGSQHLMDLIYAFNGKIAFLGDGPGSSMGAWSDSEFDRLVSESMWERFREASKFMRKPLMAQTELVLKVAGNEFLLRAGGPGMVRSINSYWFNVAPAVGVAENVARDSVEAQILALYGSGALVRHGAFVPEVVQAIETMIDAMDGIVEKHDDEATDAARPGAPRQ